jgi:hypothetical protein
LEVVAFQMRIAIVMIAGFALAEGVEDAYK